MKTQLSLFDESFADIPRNAPPSKSKIQREKKFMRVLQSTCEDMKLPAIHIRNYCGNTFYYTCPSCQNSSLVVCNNILNKHLYGHYDLLGISWAIETKHKTNKGKQSASKQLSQSQKLKHSFYDYYNVPYIFANESDLLLAQKFLLERRKL